MASVDAAETDLSKKSLKILFIGNSYTFTNKMPNILVQLARISSDLPQIEVDSVTIGGAALERHWDKGEAVNVIKNSKWDYVVLQDYSMNPIGNKEIMYLYAKLFDEVVKESGSKTILFQTWARKSSPDMQLIVSDAYNMLGVELGAIVAPVGSAWGVFRNHNDVDSLYKNDGSHPKRLGSYLTACVFYKTLFGFNKACPVIDYNEISKADFEDAQISASIAVFEWQVRR